MSSIYLEISWSDEDAQDMLEAMDRRTKDFKPLFEKIRADLEKSWSSNFMANGLPSGGWQPLDAQYASWKSARFPGAPTMIRSGKLFESLADLRGAPNEINRMDARFGTSIEYAKFHQYGTTKMPKRQVVFVEQGADVGWAEDAADYVVGEKRRGDND